MKGITPFLSSDAGLSVALTADRFKFRPSGAMGIENSTQAFFFDLIAACVAAEFEAKSYREAGSGSPSSSTLDSSLLDKAQERFEAQEKMRLELENG